MKHLIEIRHLGPIEECSLTLTDYTVFTGPQSNGKSTVAKAIYFFRTVKQDILHIMMQGGPQAIASGKDALWVPVFKSWMKDKFMQLFGSSWAMPDDMMMQYTYKKDVYIRVTLNPGDYQNKNYINIDFSRKFEDILLDLDSHSFFDMSSGQKTHEEKELVKLLNDPYETVFIPAGRNLITLLSSQLNYIFTSLDGVPLRNIDYITRKYTELILKLKPLFNNGLVGLQAAYASSLDSETAKKYKSNKPVVNQIIKDAKQILKANYRYVDGDERLYLDEKKYIKINFSSSGQQEIVWVLNLLVYYLLEGKKTFLILEEPESHLYPETQRMVGEVLGLFLSNGNAGLITTHSPYLLGTINYMLLAGQTPQETSDQVKKILPPRKWITPTDFSAYFISGGCAENAVSNEENLMLIKNELIDGASIQINEIADDLLNYTYDLGD